MTTIAARRGPKGWEISADSRATEEDGSAMTNRFTKLYRMKSKIEPITGDIIFAAAGCEFAGEALRLWLKKGGRLDLVDRGVTENDDGPPIDVLVIHKSGAYTANHLGIFIKVRDEFWAHGTGRQGALIAMDMGASTAEAVRRVRKYDANTGGRIVTMRL